MHIELGADASPEDVVAAARQIVRRLAGTDGTHDAAASASTAATAETEIEIVAREAWSALLGAHGFPFRTQNGVSPFGLAPGGAASFQFGGSIPARAAGAPGVPTADAFFGGDVNIAELDTRTFFSPAHPDAVERLPRVTVAERGNRTGDQPGALRRRRRHGVSGVSDGHGAWSRGRDASRDALRAQVPREVPPRVASNEKHVPGVSRRAAQRARRTTVINSDAVVKP
jgi:hypothetical protein